MPRILLVLIPLVLWALLAQAGPMLEHNNSSSRLLWEQSEGLDPTRVHLDSEHKDKPKRGRGHFKTPPGKAKGHHHGHEDLELPEPGTAVLFSSGLLGLALLGRRRG